MDILSLIIQLLSGAAGGHAAATMSPNTNLGALGNTLAGAIGGGVGGQLLSTLLGLATHSAGGGLDIGSIIGQIIASGASGGILTALLGVLRQAMAK